MRFLNRKAGEMLVIIKHCPECSDDDEWIYVPMVLTRTILPNRYSSKQGFICDTCGYCEDRIFRNKLHEVYDRLYAFIWSSVRTFYRCYIRWPILVVLRKTD